MHKIPKITAALIMLSVAGILGVSVFSFPLAAGQMQGDATGIGQTQPRAEGMNFFLRLNDKETGTTATEPIAPMAAPPSTTGTASDNATKNLQINATIVQGENKTQLPINAKIPAGADDAEFCAAVGNGTEVCQPLLLTLDLTENATGAPGVTGSSFKPVAFVPVQDSDGLLGGGSLISIDDTTVTIPITVIVPLTVQIQDAQICASVLSSGEMNCTQIVLDPDQTSFTSVDVDLTTDSPTLSSADSMTATQQQNGTDTATTTSEPSSTNTTTDSDSGITGSGTGTSTGDNTSDASDSNTTSNDTG